MYAHKDADAAVLSPTLSLPVPVCRCARSHAYSESVRQFASGDHSARLIIRARDEPTPAGLSHRPLLPIAHPTRDQCAHVRTVSINRPVRHCGHSIESATLPCVVRHGTTEFTMHRPAH